MFPLNARKNAFKAKQMAESSKRFIQSIYYERHCRLLSKRGTVTNMPLGKQRTQKAAFRLTVRRGHKSHKTCREVFRWFKM